MILVCLKIKGKLCFTWWTLSKNGVLYYSPHVNIIFYFKRKMKRNIWTFINFGVSLFAICSLDLWICRTFFIQWCVIYMGLILIVHLHPPTNNSYFRLEPISWIFRTIDVINQSDLGLHITCGVHILAWGGSFRKFTRENISWKLF